MKDTMIYSYSLAAITTFMDISTDAGMSHWLPNGTGEKVNIT